MPDPVEDFIQKHGGGKAPDPVESFLAKHGEAGVSTAPPTLSGGTQRWLEEEKARARTEFWASGPQEREEPFVIGSEEDRRQMEAGREFTERETRRVLGEEYDKAHPVEADLRKGLAGAARILAGPVRGVTLGAVDEGHLVRLVAGREAEERFRAEAAERIKEIGFVGKASEATGELVGALGPIGAAAKAGRAVGLGRAAGPLALGTHAGASTAVAGGDLRDVGMATLQGAGFGFLAGLSGDALRRGLSAIPFPAKAALAQEIRRRAIGAVAEGVAMPLAGAAIHGGDFTNADVDAFLGVVFGVSGHSAVARMTGERAGEVKARAVAEGKAKPGEVYSPERVKVANDALVDRETARGMLDQIARGVATVDPATRAKLERAAGITDADVVRSVEVMPPSRRPDGSIAAGYDPRAMEKGLVEEGARPAVEKAQAQGVQTVSSGVTPDGKGFAIGEAPSGEVVRVEEPARSMESREASDLASGLDLIRGKPGPALPPEAGAFSPADAGKAALHTLGLPRKAAEAVLGAGDRIVTRAARGLGLKPIRTSGAELRERVAQHHGERGAAQLRARFAARDLAVDDAGRRLTTDQQEVVFKYLTGEGSHEAVEAAAGGKYAKVAQQYREAIDANEKTLLDFGHISQQTYDKWVGKWLPRRFQKIEDLNQRDPTGKAGIAPGRIFQRKDLTPEQREKLGEIRDPAVAVAHGLAIQDATIASLRTLADLAKNPKFASAEPREGWEALPKDKRYGALAGLHVKPSVAREIKGFLGTGDPLSKVGALSDALLGEWKIATTALNPATHVRNVMGNLIFKELDHYSAADFGNITHAITAAQIIGAGNTSPLRGMRLKALKERLIHADFLSADVLELQREIDRTPGVTFSEKARNYLEKKGALAARGKVIQALPATELAIKVYGLEDTLTKVGSWVKKMREGATPEEAAARVRAAYPQFGEGLYPRLQQRVGPIGRHLIPPFGSFTEQSVRILGRAATEKPVTTAAVLGALIEGLDALGSEVSDEEREKLKDAVPPWLMPGTTRPAVDADRERGVYRILDLSTTIPLANEVESPVSGIQPGPFAKAVIEWASGTNLYTKRPVVPAGVSEEERGEIKRRHAAETLIPSTPLIPGSRSSNRIRDAESERERDLARLSKWGGVTLKDVDVGSETQKTINRLASENRRSILLRARRSAEGKPDDPNLDREIEDRFAQLDRLGRAGNGFGRKPR